MTSSLVLGEPSSLGVILLEGLWKDRVARTNGRPYHSYGCQTLTINFLAGFALFYSLHMCAHYVVLADITMYHHLAYISGLSITCTLLILQYKFHIHSFRSHNFLASQMAQVDVA